MANFGIFIYRYMKMGPKIAILLNLPNKMQTNVLNNKQTVIKLGSLNKMRYLLFIFSTVDIAICPNLGDFGGPKMT